MISMCMLCFTVLCCELRMQCSLSCVAVDLAVVAVLDLPHRL